MLVSVLMSVYKEEEKYLREAIESILNQTYRDFEFIIVGDTPQQDRERMFPIVEEYAQKDKRIKFYPNEENIGLPKSLNAGLSHCSGKYIARMDADDISVATRLEKQVAFMESHSDVLASSAWLELIDEEGKLSGIVCCRKESPCKIRLDILKNTVMGHPVSIFRRIINDEEVRYDESMNYAQDYMLWVWILQHGDISNIQEVLLYYRISSEQISSKHGLKQQQCAQRAQRAAFSKLYGFPIVDTFMEVFSSITIMNEKDIPEERAMKGFQDFFGQVKVTRRNYHVLKYIMEVYIEYYRHIIPKKHYHFLYDINRRNIPLLLISEIDYISHRLLGRNIGG